MDVNAFIIANVMYGLCLGAVFHINVWCMAKGVQWLVQAFKGTWSG